MNGEASGVPQNLKIYLLAVVLSALIGAAGSILAEAHAWIGIFVKDSNLVAEGGAPQSTDTVDQYPPIVPDLSRRSPVPAQITKFGKWVELRENVTYKAESDGFVAVSTYGNSPANGVLVHVGEDITKLPVRTRAGRWDGTVCPVSKGHYWLVHTKQKGDIAVNWLPISRSVSASEQ